MAKSLRATSLILLVGVMTLALIGCKKDDTKQGGDGDRAGKAASYNVRGQFLAYDKASDQAQIKHEKIDDFVGRDGSKSPMMAMEMSFRVADGVDIKSLDPGTKVEFDFAVDWDQQPAIEVTRIKTLPADTALEL